MADICLAVALAEVAIAALLLVRLAAGPTVSDLGAIVWSRYLERGLL